MNSGSATTALDIELDRVALRDLVADGQVRGIFAGGSIAVIKDGAVRVASAGYFSLDDHRRVSERTRLPIGCVSEVLLALVGLDLATRSRFSWDEPLAAYISEAKVLRGEHASLTAAHLLAHSSGLDFPHTVAHGPRSPSLSSLLKSAPYFPPRLFYSRNPCNLRLLHLVLNAVEPGCVEAFLRTYLKAESPTFGNRAAGLTADYFALSTVQIAQCGQLFIDEVFGAGEGKRANDCSHALHSGFRYAIDDALSPRPPPWYRLRGDAYYSSGHFPGYTVFLLISPRARLSLAMATNSNRQDFMTSVLAATNLTTIPVSTRPAAESSRDIWHTCVDPRHIAGTYAAHGETLHVHEDASVLRLTGTHTHYFPATKYEATALTPQRGGFFTVAARPGNIDGALSPPLIRFISTTSSDGIPEWMRIRDQIYRRV